MRRGGSGPPRFKADHGVSGVHAGVALSPARDLRGDAVDLFARESELRVLDELIAEGGRLVALEGGAGLGKTVLLEAGRARARSAGLLVLSARGDEL